jgi:hypothetical protein
MISKHQIRFESILVGVGSLMIECLIDGTYAIQYETVFTLGSRAR